MRYLRLLIIFYKNCLLTDLEYRTNFMVNVFMSVFWILFALLGLQVLFLHRDSIGDWNYYEAMLVTGLFVLFNGFIDAFLEPNIRRIVEQVRDGTFDFVLIKPINSQFLATFRYVSLWKLADMFLGLGIVVYSVSRLDVSPSPARVLLFALLLSGAAVIVYSIWVLMVTTAFWFVKIENITELFMAVYETGRFPVSVYPAWIRGILTFVLPVAFITTFPAAVILGRFDTGLLIWAIVLAVALFVISSRFWNYAVRRYSSASS